MNLIDLFSAQTATKQSEYSTPASPTISGNTGNGGGSAILDFISRGVDIYKDVKAADSVVAPETRSSTTPGQRQTLANATWLPWAIGGAVLLLIGVILMRK